MCKKKENVLNLNKIQNYSLQVHNTQVDVCTLGVLLEGKTASLHASVHHNESVTLKKDTSLVQG